MNERHRTLRQSNATRPNACLNGYVGIDGKWMKRQSNKRARRTEDINNGGAYKKAFGWFEWY